MSVKCEIIQLNHASLLLVMGDVRLLFDPWFEGEAFDGGWGLRWQHAQALDIAATATHLWLSHPHSDHLHYSTLKRLQALAPDIEILANRSYNYDMEKPLRALGFTRLRRFAEGHVLSLQDGLTLERIGTGIIDNALIIRWQGRVILNLNDCVLQPRALRQLMAHTGAVDLLLNNFNHAGKLLHYPEQPPADTRAALLGHYGQQLVIVRPRYCVPFASHHHYLSPLAQLQNASLLEPHELAQAVPPSVQLVALYPGQRATIDVAVDAPVVVSGDKPLATAMPLPQDVAIQSELSPQAIATFHRRISRAFGLSRFALPPLCLHVMETHELWQLRHGRLHKVSGQQPDIEAPQARIEHWLASPYGTDAFMVGAHFTILRPCIGRLKWLVALLLLAEANISPRTALSPACWAFLWRRRHEALAALLSWRVSSSYQ